MAPPDAAALARLEVHVQTLMESNRRLAEKVDAIEAKLDQSAGGFTVLRWFGFGSLASIIGLGTTIYVWLHKAQ